MTTASVTSKSVTELNRVPTYSAFRRIFVLSEDLTEGKMRKVAVWMLYGEKHAFTFQLETKFLTMMSGFC